MKSFGKLIKIVFILAMVTGASFASGTGYNLDDQANDTLDTIAGIGFTNPTKLTFTREAVDTLLDPRFQPNAGADLKTRNAKTFLYNSLSFAIPNITSHEYGKAGFLTKLQAVLEKNSGAIEIDIESIAYDVNIYPTFAQTNKAGKLISTTLDSLHEAVICSDLLRSCAVTTAEGTTSYTCEDDGMGLFGDDDGINLSMPTVTHVSATVPAHSGEDASEEMAKKKATLASLALLSDPDEGMGLFE